VFSRKQPSSDHIEEDVQPFDGDDDVEEDEEQQPRPASKSVKKEKKPTKGKGRAKTENQNGADDEDRIDFNNFEDQPLIRGDAAKLKGLAQDWSQIRKGIHQPSFDQLRGIAVAIADAAEGEENQKARRCGFRCCTLSDISNTSGLPNSTTL